MASTGNEVERIVNEALPSGIPNINWIYEGSRAARAALRCYRQTRRELLRATDWPFARRTVVLQMLKGPPPPGGYNPAQPWTSSFPPPDALFEYAYPSDAIEIRAIMKPGFVFNLDPRHDRFRIDNDNTLPTPARVILCDIMQAMAVYIGDVTDPTLWEPGFRAAMIAALKKKLDEKLSPSDAMRRDDTAEAQGIAAAADMQRG